MKRIFQILCSCILLSFASNILAVGPRVLGQVVDADEVYIIDSSDYFIGYTVESALEELVETDITDTLF